MFVSNEYIDCVVTESDLFINEIESLFYEIAMEEEVAKNNTQVSQDESGMIDKMIKIIKDIITKLNGMIQMNFLKFKNYLAKIAQSDNGFKSSFKEAFVKKKPMEGIKLISYDYNPQLLDTELARVNKAVFGLFSNMQNKTSYTALSDPNTANDMDRTPDEIFQSIFKKLNCPPDVKDLSTYFLCIKNKYRSNKREILFTASKTQEYYAITQSHAKLMEKINKSQTLVANQVAVLKSNLHNTIQNKQVRPEVKKRAVKQCKNLSAILNFFIRFVDIYMQLQLERLFTYRTVLKRLYDF